MHGEETNTEGTEDGGVKKDSPAAAQRRKALHKNSGLRDYDDYPNIM